MQLLPTPNAIGITTAQGLTLTRRWMVDCCKEDLYTKIRLVSESHYPGHSNCVPVAIAVGPADDKVKFLGLIKDTEDPTKYDTAVTDIPDDKISEYLEIWDKAIITCQYQYLLIDEVWPTLNKPAHPKGTVLSCQVRGSGEILQITPFGLQTNKKGGYMPDVTINSRIVVPNAEYILVCDRMKDTDVCNAMHDWHWRDREGSVNWEEFLGEPTGTLLFDSWTLDPTFAPDIDDCRRWRLACTLRSRQIEGYGPYPNDIDNTATEVVDGKTVKKYHYPIGWNHDYKVNTLADHSHGTKTRPGWWFVMLSLPIGTQAGGQEETPFGNCEISENGGAQLVPRYPYKYFKSLFCDCGCLPARGKWCNLVEFSNCSELSPSSEQHIAHALAGETSSGSVPSIEQIIHDSRGVAKRAHARHEREGIQILEDGRWSNQPRYESGK